MQLLCFFDYLAQSLGIKDGPAAFANHRPLALETRQGLRHLLPRKWVTLITAVEMFIEKPPENVARKLIQIGALWNTFVLVSTASTLIAIFQQTTPDLYRSLSRVLDVIGTPREENVIEEVYRELEPVNFSKSVLEVLPLEHRQRLMVLPALGMGGAIVVPARSC